MRAVIQRVTEASVAVDGNIRSAIRNGLLVLVAVTEPDSAADIEWLSKKVVGLRIFDDENSLMNRSVKEVEGEILVVSQFTLFGSTAKGFRPSYSHAAKPEIAEPMYEQFLAKLTQDLGRPVQAGVFREHMLVTMVNDGPVTIIIDSKTRE